jgi:hypothetical protein
VRDEKNPSPRASDPGAEQIVCSISNVMLPYTKMLSLVFRTQREQAQLLLLIPYRVGVHQQNDKNERSLNTLE